MMISFAGQMRVKGILLLMLCILLTSIFYCLVGDQKPSIGDLVTETHRQLSQPLIRFKQVVVPAVKDGSTYYLKNNYPSQDEDERYMEDLGDKYLKKLGFTDHPRLYPEASWKKLPLPVFVTPVKSGQVQLVKGFVKSLQDFFPDVILFMYDLALDPDQLLTVKRICNGSNINCTLVRFPFEEYPSHLSDLNLGAFRPLILQQVLDQTGGALWLDPTNFLAPDAQLKARRTLDSAKKEGLLSWTIDQPTTAMTHPRMFEYFHAARDNYYFHRMVEPSSLLVYNTKKMHEELMLPWVRCALILDCISPMGAQSSGCRFDKKPLYRYSGCHHYDVSALNVILGYMYNYSVKSYAAPESDKFFRRVTLEEVNSVLDNDYSDLFKTESTPQQSPSSSFSSSSPSSFSSSSSSSINSTSVPHRKIKRW